MMNYDIWNIRTKRKPSLFLFQVVMVFLLAAHSEAIPAGAQSLPTQEQNSRQPEESEQPDLINADRPGIADGSTVIGPKRVQLESGFQEEFHREGDSHQHILFLPTLLRLGLNSHWEARLEGNTLTNVNTFEPAGVVTHDSGLAPLSLGIKYHFMDTNGLRHPSLGTIVRVFPSWGSSDFRPHHVTGDLRLVADWDFCQKPKLSLNPNVGVGRYEDEQGRAFNAGLLAVTLNYLPSNKLNPFIDLGLQAPEESDGRASIITDTGIAYIVRRNLQLDASVGTGVRGRTPPHPFISFGISFRSRSIGHRK